jgi:hypothetical protein
MTLRRRCGGAARRSKPRTSRRIGVASRDPDGPWLVSLSEGDLPVTEGMAQGSGSSTVEGSFRALKRPTTGDLAEQTYKHRARDALGLADLRLFGLQHASMSRGIEVRGSEHFGASGPLASRAPSASGVSGLSRRPCSAEAKLRLRACAAEAGQIPRPTAGFRIALLPAFAGMTCVRND